MNKGTRVRMLYDIFRQVDIGAEGVVIEPSSWDKYVRVDFGGQLEVWVHEDEIEVVQ